MRHKSSKHSVILSAINDFLLINISLTWNIFLTLIFLKYKDKNWQHHKKKVFDEVDEKSLISEKLLHYNHKKGFRWKNADAC